ncbi:MAG: FHA domain-containing protein [Bacteroidota bacterium]
MRLSFFLLLFLFYGFEIYSQDFKLINIDNQSYPNISLFVELSENLNIHNLKVIENGEERLLKIDSTNLHHGIQAICYLIDFNKFNMDERQIIYKALSNAVLNLKSGTLINICYILSNNQGNCFIPFSYEFTDRPNSFVQFVKKISKELPANQERDNLYCALENTISFMDAKEQLPKQKTIIFLTKNFNNFKKIDQILDDKKNKSINIKLLSNINDSLTINPTYFYSFKPKLEEKELFDKLNKASFEKDLININISKNYLIEFTSIQTDYLNNIEIHYFDQVIKTTFTKPFKDTFPGIVWFFIIILGLVIFIIILIIKQISLKRKLLSLKETVSLLFDKKLKILGKQTKTPIIEIRMENNLTNHHIKKLNTSIGRKKSCDIVIDNLTISSHHASITNEGGEFYIQDHESTNGVFVNDIKINKKSINNDDIIRLGKAILTIHY